MSPAEYEQLVEFLGGRFTEIDRRFTEVDRRFTEVDRRFNDIDHRFDAVDARFDDLRRDMLSHFDEIYRRLERLEQEYQTIIQALRRIEAQLSDERGRREILTRDLAELKQQVAALQARIEDIEERLGH
jgi:predicted  nucleic acid-binding Zn-ribbon protein